MLDPVEFGKQIGELIRDATAPLHKRIEELEARQLERGDKGDAGDKGEPGKDAEPVAVPDVVDELVKSDLLAPVIDLYVAEAVAKHFAEHPVVHGKDGKDGEPGKSEKGDKGDAGLDGVGLAGAIINRSGELVVTKTNGEAVNLGVVVGNDGTPGHNGTDGLGFDDMDVSYDGERSFTITWQRGDLVKTKTFIVPTVIDRGYWREGSEAKTGDAMTHDGTLWIALRDTKAKPARESDDWRIGARKGRDGAQGPPGKEYKAPEPVKLVPNG